MNDYVDPLPKDDDIPRMRVDLVNFLEWMNGMIPVVLRARPGDLAKIANLEKEPGRNGGGDSGPPRPTERAAVADVDQAKVLRDHQNAIRYMLSIVHSTACDAMDRTNTAYKLVVPDTKPKPADVTMCAELYCEDPSDGRRGRCEPCDRWTRRWAEKRNAITGTNAYAPSDAPHVPREVIDARIKLRENRKVHVTGPLVAQ